MTVSILAIITALAPLLLALIESWKEKAPDRKAKRRQLALEAIDEAIGNLDDPRAAEFKLHQLYDEVQYARLASKPRTP